MKNKLAICGLSVFLALNIVACGSTQPDHKSVTTQNLSIQESAQLIGHNAAKWQVDNIEKGNYDYLATRYHKGSSDPKNWIQAAFYIGLTRWTETVDDKTLLAHIDTMAKQQNYDLIQRRYKHADDHAIGQTYLWLAKQTNNPAAYQKTQVMFDKILANHKNVSLAIDESKPKLPGYKDACQERWCWSDALFMAPRTWLQMSNMTGDKKYFDFADKEFWATSDYLFSEEHGLFYRDSRYFTMKSDNGQPVFWSRGNGWVFSALPLLLDDLPKDHPSRSQYIELYKKNAAGLVKIQKPDGYWAASLLDPNKVKTPETSGTGFITFGLAWGVNNGILTDDKYVQAVNKGWKALEQAVLPNGKVTWVQQVGRSPEPVAEHETQLYGVGAVLLAASEMTKWKK
ncbi:glycoside hydrolase family 88 protein [Paraglaciecola aquimarina]|uniref:Glycoside hydrolase family 88 protein n=1 Tax=Paraglaciecola algarum TaxID=3050085 RepID=A0ABS9D4I2_9ALTE|nr:glycoside hydrolase family 88 protein [Paraglaciecola sp. G1-23]MCF2946943.1 glycoside hydrolase family 88 protein [Paraglaciecola sp. G1-23]